MKKTVWLVILTLSLLFACACTPGGAPQETAAVSPGAQTSPEASQSEEAAESEAPAESAEAAESEAPVETPAVTTSQSATSQIYSGTLIGFQDNFSFEIQTDDGTFMDFNVFDEHLKDVLYYLAGNKVWVEVNPSAENPYLIYAVSSCGFTDSCIIATLNGFADNHSVELQLEDGSYLVLQVNDEAVKDVLWQHEGEELLVQYSTRTNTISAVYPNPY